MRELSLAEVALVSGGTGQCTPEDSNNFYGISDSASVGSDIINIYEGLVSATSYIIERVATAL